MTENTNSTVTTGSKETAGLQTLAQFINGHKSVAGASRALGVSRQTVDRWQRGSFKPSPAQVELARQKGVDLTLRLVPLDTTTSA